jgi:transcriptional regulator with XRE-family HTH domain
MASIGQELKRERELRGISLKEIAEATKINLRFLRSLEEDQFDLLPGRFFVRGIIRSYAGYLGLEEHTILNLYQETLEQKEHPPEEADKEGGGEESGDSAKRLISYLVMAVFLTAVIVVFFVLVQKKDPETVSSPETPAPAFVEDKTPPPPRSEPEPVVTGLRLDISFQQETWIQVFADGELQLDTIRRAGDSFQITALESFRINTGNAGGFTFTLNGEPARALGPPGSVVKDTMITLENYREFLEEK